MTKPTIDREVDNLIRQLCIRVIAARGEDFEAALVELNNVLEKWKPREDGESE